MFEGFSTLDTLVIVSIMLSTVSLLVALFITTQLFLLARKQKGVSMAKTLYLLTFAFFVFFLLQVAQVLNFFPDPKWKAAQTIVNLVFMFAVYYAINVFYKSIEAYETLKKKLKPRDSD